jgi:hypothetical protein
MTTIEAPTTPVVGIWDDQETSLFTKYRVSATFVGWVMGGVPQKPEIIESWLRQRIIGGDDELRLQLLRTLADLDYDIPQNATVEQIEEAVKIAARERNGNTFRRDTNGLYLSAYQLKAATKECVNILYAGERWGVTKKGPKSFTAERVYVDEPCIYLGRSEPDGTHLQVGQVNGPKGPRSTLTYIDYCDRPTIAFTMSSLKDCIEPDQWREIFTLMQRSGIGALRSMGYGQFVVTGFDKL